MFILKVVKKCERFECVYFLGKFAIFALQYQNFAKFFLGPPLCYETNKSSEFQVSI